MALCSVQVTFADFTLEHLVHENALAAIQTGAATATGAWGQDADDVKTWNYPLDLASAIRRPRQYPHDSRERRVYAGRVCNKIVMFIVFVFRVSQQILRTW
jgi:hypothetical protein